MGQAAFVLGAVRSEGKKMAAVPKSCPVVILLFS